MEIEQKAKAYDNLIERLKDFQFQYRFSSFSDVIEENFPELAESEDERIRKDIIHLVQKSHEQGGYALHKYEADEMLAWLEKQNSNVDNANKEYWRGYREGKQEILDKYAELEKQGQKPQGKSALEAAKEENVDNQNCVNPADKSKIKPKFKTGDRVIGIVSGMPYFITEVCDDHYNTESGCIIMFCSQDNFELYERNPAEWSEEDEEYLNDIIRTLRNFVVNGGSVAKKYTEEEINWLKSLRPQPQWKPSDEQIHALNAINVTGGISNVGQGQELINLYQDLKKLKG